MRKFFLPAALVALAATLSAAPALAYPNKGNCTGCHRLDSRVTVAVSFLGCSGNNATYSVSVSDTYNSGEGWAVFSGTTNTVNGYYPATTQFTVAGGATYTVRGVSDDTTAGGGKGGSAAVTISPVCNTCTPSPEVCTDGIDNDCDGAIDCQDSNCVSDPACTLCVPSAEICDDGIDNDCDGKIDCADRNCRRDPACTGGCTATKRSERGLCTDGIDNDCDGLIDCADKDCRRDAACR